MEPQLLKKYPTMEEMQFFYVRMRSMGTDREETLKKLLEQEERLSLPYEQWLLRQIAIGDAMAEKKELTDTAAALTENAISEFLGFHPKMEKTMNRVKERILQPENYGPAASYPPWEAYDPGWETGDLYAFPLNGYIPRLFRLEGRSALLFVAGKQLNPEGYTEELVYLTLCETDVFPRSIEELNALGYLPGFTVFREYQYLHALQLRREKELRDLKLQKIGHFTESPFLFRERPCPERNAQNVYPCYCGKEHILLDRSICVSYQHFGNISNAEQAALAKKQWNYGGECREAKGEAPLSVVMEKTPLQNLSLFTFFYHKTRLGDRIPNRSTMIPKD